MNKDTKAQQDNKESEREAYEPPGIKYREPLEAIATTCVPAPPAKGSPGACPLGPISS